MTEQENPRGLWETTEYEDLKNIYFNSFGVGLSESDIVIVLKKNGINEAVLNASYITIKAFALTLLEAVKDFEETTGNKIILAGETKENDEDN
ncbi:MAG: hypothetical protein J7647_04915 [Cyanobacteria bacterium SBLK]|nr:hypothetical protein [Cyanobacteria bacterium SBLK]